VSLPITAGAILPAPFAWDFVHGDGSPVSVNDIDLSKSHPATVVDCSVTVVFLPFLPGTYDIVEIDGAEVGATFGAFIPGVSPGFVRVKAYDGPDLVGGIVDFGVTQSAPLMRWITRIPFYGIYELQALPYRAEWREYAAGDISVSGSAAVFGGRVVGFSPQTGILDTSKKWLAAQHWPRTIRARDKPSTAAQSVIGASYVGIDADGLASSAAALHRRAAGVVLRSDSGESAVVQSIRPTFTHQDVLRWHSANSIIQTFSIALTQRESVRFFVVIDGEIYIDTVSAALYVPRVDRNPARYSGKILAANVDGVKLPDVWDGEIEIDDLCVIYVPNVTSGVASVWRDTAPDGYAANNIYPHHPAEWRGPAEFINMPPPAVLIDGGGTTYAPAGSGAFSAGGVVFVGLSGPSLNQACLTAGPCVFAAHYKINLSAGDYLVGTPAFKVYWYGTLVETIPATIELTTGGLPGTTQHGISCELDTRTIDGGFAKTARRAYAVVLEYTYFDDSADVQKTASVAPFISFADGIRFSRVPFYYSIPRSDLGGGRESRAVSGYIDDNLLGIELPEATGTDAGNVVTTINNDDEFSFTITWTPASTFDDEIDNQILMADGAGVKIACRFLYATAVTDNAVDVFANGLSGFTKPAQAAAAAGTSTVHAGVWPSGATRIIVSLVTKVNNSYTKYGEVHTDWFPFRKRYKIERNGATTLVTDYHDWITW
jgi:hypothetical protein